MEQALGRWHHPSHFPVAKDPHFFPGSASKSFLLHQTRTSATFTRRAVVTIFGGSSFPDRFLFPRVISIPAFFPYLDICASVRPGSKRSKPSLRNPLLSSAIVPVSLLVASRGPAVPPSNLRFPRRTVSISKLSTWVVISVEHVSFRVSGKLDPTASSLRSWSATPPLFPIPRSKPRATWPEVDQGRRTPPQLSFFALFELCKVHRRARDAVSQDQATKFPLAKAITPP